jgi:hypothetical protein
MNYDFIAIPDQDVPQARDPLFQHLVVTYASETNKTASMWKAIPDDLLDFKPQEKVNTIRAILVHQILSERRFFAQFVGIQEPPVEELLPPGDQPPVQAYLERYVTLAKRRLPQLARGDRRLVADRDAVLWWAETPADLDVLAACPPHPPPSDPGPDMAAPGGSARPRYLRTIRGCEMGRGRPDLFA